MTAADIVDNLIEGRRPSFDVPGMEDESQFMRDFVSRKEAGKKLNIPGQVAAYTCDWPEFHNWYDYRNNFKDDAEGRKQFQAFMQNPELWHNSGVEGSVHYHGTYLRVKGIPGSFNWEAEWNRGSSTSWQPVLTITLHHWDKERFWRSHYKKPVMTDYKKQRAPEFEKVAMTKQHWDDADPNFFDVKPMDPKIKDRLVAQAKKFVEKLGQVAEITKVRWHVPELYQEAKPSWGDQGKDKRSEKGFTQIGGDWGDPWKYGGDWFNQDTGDIVHFDGTDDRSEIQSDNRAVDDAMTPEQQKLILKAVNLDNTNEWENAEDEIRQGIADTLQSQVKHTVYRTSVEEDSTIAKDWSRHINDIMGQYDKDPEKSAEIWKAMPPANKMLEIAQHIGWHEFDFYPEKYTKSELSVYLGIDL